MNKTPKIKICGTTNEYDAKRLTEYDISYLGFIITEKEISSKIDLETAIQIIKDLPNKVKKVVGLGDIGVNEIIDICRKTDADVVQLQRGGALNEIEKIKNILPKLTIWKVIFTDKKPDLKVVKKFEEVSDAILIHSKEEEWPTGLKIAKTLKKPFILAGGLNINNIEVAIKLFKPAVVDLIRGVETIPGKKDFKKVEQLINKIREK